MRTVKLNNNTYYCGDYKLEGINLYLTIQNPSSIDQLVIDAKANGNNIYIYEDGTQTESYFGYSTVGSISIKALDVVIQFSQTYNDRESLKVLVGDRVTVADAHILRKDIETLANFADDETAGKNVWAYGKWETNTLYKVSDKRTYDNVLYKCLQEHTSQDSWIPPEAPSLWAKVINEDPTGDLPVWQQPDSTNPYMTGDRVYYPIKGATIYESLIDNNIWSPVEYTEGWKEVTNG